MKKTGFTLIELLVVFTIIAILAAILFGSFTAAQRGSRDSQRKFDLKNIQAALEQYYYVQSPHSYPTASNWTNMVSQLQMSQNFIKTAPQDPANTYPYIYTAISCSGSPLVCANYELCARLENTSDPAAGSSTCTSNTQYNYALHAP